MNEKTAF